MRKLKLCIVDDDREEIRRFRETMATRFIIGAGTSLDSAREELRQQGHSSPDLYVLDLYFPESGSSTLAQLEAVANAREKVRASQAEFASILARFGQTIQGGFRLADRLSHFGRREPFVFFSRKATMEDAMQALRHGALSVIKKPDPIPSEMRADLRTAYNNALARAAQDVARDIEEAFHRSTFLWKHGQNVITAIISFLVGLLVGLVLKIL